jgi:hypothetical protein
MNITSCTVRVLKSYDYCHFEVLLVGNAAALDLTADTPIPVEEIDELRKTAARLADKAVEQYKLKKRAIEVGSGYSTKLLREEVAEIKAMPEQEWTPEEKASVKRLGDIEHAAQYDYQDEWQQEDET